MIITLKMPHPKDGQWVLENVAHIVSNGTFERDRLDPDRWNIDLMDNNWWARIKDGVLTVSGRYADDATMQAVKQMLLFRCDNEVKEL